ncbi:hypothetical protein NDU88_005241 [Pleurodeles waltl]|uniref:Uncharacterized protein n=1 Tax=Pleurodeles waltl TaxID=8319 RepID=A0AAV7NNE3_PLEWA|nr:hypothetical protein NDU88_005241 [Pleurodeles waltl]
MDPHPRRRRAGACESCPSSALQAAACELHLSGAVRATACAVPDRRERELADRGGGGARRLLGDPRGTAMLGYLEVQPSGRWAGRNALTLWLGGGEGA